MSKQTYNLLLAATGSVAALKIPVIVESILELNKNQEYKFEIGVVVTDHAKHFFECSNLPPGVVVYDDETEWKSWKNRGDPVVHIDLGKWADTMVIAPLDANTLAKMAQGLCDNLLTCITRAWDMKKPLLFCPAMNTRMWEHPLTSKHIQILEEWGHIAVPPIKKLLICGDTGVGAMAEVTTIVQRIKSIADGIMLGRGHCTCDKLNMKY